MSPCCQHSGMFLAKAIVTVAVFASPSGISIGRASEKSAEQAAASLNESSERSQRVVLRVGTSNLATPTKDDADDISDAEIYLRLWIEALRLQENPLHGTDGELAADVRHLRRQQRR